LISQILTLFLQFQFKLSKNNKL